MNASILLPGCCLALVFSERLRCVPLGQVDALEQHPKRHRDERQEHGEDDVWIVVMG